MLLNEIKTIPVEYIMTYLETREKSIIYESTASILKEITSIFENLRGNYAKKTNWNEDESSRTANRESVPEI